MVLAFSLPADKRPKLPREFVSIPAGNPWMGDDSSSRVSVGAFYISTYEVTNLQYRTFFDEVATRLSPAERVAIACDTTGWKEVLAYSEPVTKHYFRHPSFNNYPVVNISHEGAARYCQWFQERIQADNPGVAIEVRLPSKVEWIWAAQGGRSQAMYPWGNYRLRNNKGQRMCNFREVPDHQVYRSRKTGKPEVAVMPYSAADAVVLTAEVKSFRKNDYGLYNMCGNVAEMISENGIAAGGSWNDYGADVHIRATGSYERSAPTVGFRPVIVVKELK
ncbi:MAG TPA: SUMF1/EgtB/PvdO family nonheme iron enzyme [Flavisolibacter sp.]